MKKLLVVLILIPFLMTGCATVKGLFGGDLTAERVLADIGCITALTGAGVAVAGDPMVGGAATVLDILSAITRIGSSSLPLGVLSACTDSLAYAKKDAAGAADVIAATTANKTSGVAAAKKPVAAQKAMQADKSKAPVKPTVVTIQVSR